MKAGADELDWLRQCGTLTTVRDYDHDDHDSPRAGQASAARLVAVARALVAGGRQHGEGCMLGSEPAAHRACELADELAAHGPPGPAAEVETGRLPEAYLQALEDAAHAVYLCRRLGHPRGQCWFADSGHERDLCGHVLIVAHALRRVLPR